MMVRHQMSISEERVLVATPICPGVAMGVLQKWQQESSVIPELFLREEELEHEICRYRKARERTEKDILKLQRQEIAIEGVEIFQTHVQMLHDPLLSTEIEQQIRALKKNAEYVFYQKVQELRQKFSALVDPYFRERKRDIEDIARRLLGYLMDRQRKQLKQLPLQGVLFAQEMTPSLVAEANNRKVVALITEVGGPTSHAAIMARAKGIPYVSGVKEAFLPNGEGAEVMVNGGTGEIFLYPTLATVERYHTSRRLYAQQKKSRGLAKAQAETVDGQRIWLLANVDGSEQVKWVHQYGADGVGLYRSECSFLGANRFPSEEEQVKVYTPFVEKLRGLPFIVRVFDMGGDKRLAFSPVHEKDSVLGGRSMRFLLKEPQLFKEQIRAILRATAGGVASLLFPMISSLTELRAAKALVEESQEELRREAYICAHTVKMGCMIEVPSAALTADHLAAECDFFSIGTNDLGPHTMAIDRSDHTLDTSTHPSILRLMHMVVVAAQRANIPVHVCGEVAADPRYIPLLFGLGINTLSVAASALQRVKESICRMTWMHAQQLAQEALRLTTAEEVRALIDNRVSIQGSIF